MEGYARHAMQLENAQQMATRQRQARCVQLLAFATAGACRGLAGAYGLLKPAHRRTLLDTRALIPVASPP